MKRIIKNRIYVISIVLAIMICSIIALMYGVCCPRNPNLLTIGIIQTASHPALDQVQEGVIQTLKRELGDDLCIIQNNAQGSINTAYAIAQSLHDNNNVRLIVTIGSLAAQAMANVENEKPIVYAAVTDPRALGISEHKNVCGVSDQVDIKKQVDALIMLVPTARTIALLYNPAEVNSQAAVEVMKRQLSTHHLLIKEYQIANEAEVALVTRQACENADALLVPNDNLVAATMPLIARIAVEAAKPLVAGIATMVAQGALVGAGGLDYHQHGNDAAVYVCKLLKEHKNPSILPIGQSLSTRVYLNKKTASALHINVPKDLVTDIIEG